MIWSIGYERLTPRRLVEIVGKLDATLVDCRSNPSGRVKRGFSRSALELLLPGRYVWAGVVLGGRGMGTTPEGLGLVRRWATEDGTKVLLCKEEAPGDCHRHHQIATRLLPSVDVNHIYQDEVITASSLARAIAGGDDAEYDFEVLAL